MKYVGVATKTLEIQNICVNLCVSSCLVFYNIQLPTYVVVELKRTPIKPHYMGQLNFYIFVVDDTLRGEHDNKTIGLLLCNGGDKVVAQYAFSGYELRIGVSGYQLTKAIPDNLRSTLPSIEEVEEELSKAIKLIVT